MLADLWPLIKRVVRVDSCNHKRRIYIDIRKETIATINIIVSSRIKISVVVNATPR